MSIEVVFENQVGVPTYRARLPEKISHAKFTEAVGNMAADARALPFVIVPEYGAINGYVIQPDGEYQRMIFEGGLARTLP